MEERYCPNCYEPITEHDHDSGACPACGRSLPTLMSSLPRSRPVSRTRRESELDISSPAAVPPQLEVMHWGAFRFVLLLFAVTVILSLPYYLILMLGYSGSALVPQKMMPLLRELSQYSVYLMPLIYLISIASPKSHGVQSWAWLSCSCMALALFCYFTSGLKSSEVDRDMFFFRGERGFTAIDRVRMLLSPSKPNTLWIVGSVLQVVAFLGLGLAMIQSAKFAQRPTLRVCLLGYVLISFLLRCFYLYASLILSRSSSRQPGAIRWLLQSGKYTTFFLALLAVILVFLLRAGIHREASREG